jgi:hypothetical protein
MMRERLREQWARVIAWWLDEPEPMRLDVWRAIVRQPPTERPRAQLLILPPLPSRRRR